jgi:hypothetical protein
VSAGECQPTIEPNRERVIGGDMINDEGVGRVGEAGSLHRVDVKPCPKLRKGRNDQRNRWINDVQRIASMFYPEVQGADPFWMASAIAVSRDLSLSVRDPESPEDNWRGAPAGNGGGRRRLWPASEAGVTVTETSRHRSQRAARPFALAGALNEVV